MTIPKNVTINRVTTIYKGFEIDVSREPSLGGDILLYYSIFRESDGWCLEDSFSSGEDNVLSFTNYLKAHVDDYIQNPGDYDD